jgi:hypothetical protein
MREYVLSAVRQQLDQDWVELIAEDGLLALNAAADPVLVELWDNEKDAAYDQL